MKKKALSNIVATVLIVISATAGVAVLYNLINLIIEPEPHFKIMKEECRNEITLRDSQRYNRDLARFNSYRLDLLEAKTEVERLIAESHIRNYKDLSVIPGVYETQICEQVEVKGNVIEWCYDEDDCGKIEITVEWLDENCECAESINGEECSKYRCQEYIVGVWGQIK